MKEPFDPEFAITQVRREFGEHGGVAPSIERSSTFTVMEPGVMPDIFAGRRTPDREGCYLYSRHFNPTVDVLDRYLAAMEGTEFAIGTASGMAAIACAILQICRSGDHVVASSTIYGGSYAFFDKYLPRFRITTGFVNPRDLDGIRAAIRPTTKLLYTETIGNPTLAVANIRAMSEIAREHGLTLIVDNTFSPMVISPARLGADIVVHSMTKFINGAADLLAGCVCCSREFGHSLYDLQTGSAMLLGPVMDPRVAFDIIQRLPHLPIRMREHGRRALAIATRLDELGIPVIYPGLPSHPDHALFQSMANPGYGHGGILAIDCGSAARANQLMDVLQNELHFGLMAVSLGYFDTLMSVSSSSTSSEISEGEQMEMGLSPGLLRLSIGISGALESRLDQIERAVKKVF